MWPMLEVYLLVSINNLDYMAKVKNMSIGKYK